MTDIVVLDHKIHGLSAADYVTALEDALPEHEVALARTAAERERLVPDATVATGYQISESLVASADSLSLFVCTFAGTDHLPTDALEANGVAVESASGVHGSNVAEQVLGYLLTFVRRLDKGWRQKQASTWSHYQAGELNGSTATVVGQGPIGRTIVDRLDAFDVTTIGVRYTPDKGGPADEVIGFDDSALDAALARTDHLVLACPLTDTTEELVDAEALRLLPTHATVTNIARGAVVDTDALVAAVQTNEIRGAALDVTDPEPLPPDNPLWDLPNCQITPHNAGHTPAYWSRCAEIVASALRDADQN